MISLPTLNDPPPGDGCGPCTACCDAIGVQSLGKPYYARCMHLKPELVGAACMIYETRPDECRKYRCAYHQGLLGTRTDRRPDQNGLVVTLDLANGRWSIDFYEAKPGAATPDRVRFIAQMIRTHKRTRHLPFSDMIRVFPFGADLPVPWTVSAEYDPNPPPNVPQPVKREPGMMTFNGKIRELLGLKR